jgi:hypothetical protein
MQVALTMVSSNTKTGPIPTTTSDRATCPTTCPFYDKGCYAKSGPQAIHWRKVSNAERGFAWDEFVNQIRKIAKNQIWRHNVSGDLQHNDGNIDYKKLRQLIMANKGRRGFTYTHHKLNEHNIVSLQNANMMGFTINASCESIEEADRVMTEHEIPAVAVVNSEKTDRFYTTSSGRKVVTCPAALFPGKVTCATCGLCQKADRNFVIAFPSHGNAKRTVNEIVG